MKLERGSLFRVRVTENNPISGSTRVRGAFLDDVASDLLKSALKFIP